MITRIFFGAEDGHITLHCIEENFFHARTSNELLNVLQTLEIDKNTTLYSSSSLDFADEHGFKKSNEAHSIIDEALDIYRGADFSKDESTMQGITDAFMSISK